MSKKFEEAYKEYLNSQAPDLWGRINDRLDAKQQDCLGRMADDNVVELRRQKHRRAKKNRGRYIRLYGAIAACVAALILAVPVLRIVKGGSGSQMDSYELAKVENGEIENITEEAAEEAAPPAGRAEYITGGGHVDELHGGLQTGVGHGKGAGSRWTLFL